MSNIKFFKNTYDNEVITVPDNSIIEEVEEYILDNLIIVYKDSIDDITKYIIPKIGCPYETSDIGERYVIMPRMIPNNIYKYIKYINDNKKVDNYRIINKTLNDFIEETGIEISIKDVELFINNIHKYNIDYKTLPHKNVIWIHCNDESRRLVIDNVPGVDNLWKVCK